MRLEEVSVPRPGQWFVFVMGPWRRSGGTCRRRGSAGRRIDFRRVRRGVRRAVPAFDRRAGRGQAATDGASILVVTHLASRYADLESLREEES